MHVSAHLNIHSRTIFKKILEVFLVILQDSMEFWLDFGVDGFRVDAVKHLVEDDTFPDEPVIDDVELLSYDNLDHIYTTNQNLTFEIIQGWTDLIKEKNKDGHSR